MDFAPTLVEMKSDYEDEDDLEIEQRNRPMETHDIRLYLIRRTVLEMLRDRGYLVGDTEIQMTKEDFSQKFGRDIKHEALDLCKGKRNDPTEQIYVFFIPELKVGVSVVKRYAETMKERKVKRAILVVQKKLTLYGTQSVTEMSGSYKIEVFQEPELLVNVRNSVLVPEHTVLTEDEVKKILDRYSVKKTQLPRLLADDPIARYYGLKKGQMVKIIRPGQVTESVKVAYRIVM